MCGNIYRLFSNRKTVSKNTFYIRSLEFKNFPTYTLHHVLKLLSFIAYIISEELIEVFLFLGKKKSSPKVGFFITPPTGFQFYLQNTMK